jgi:hypothetical protein
MAKEFLQSKKPFLSYDSFLRCPKKPQSDFGGQNSQQSGMWHMKNVPLEILNQIMVISSFYDERFTNNGLSKKATLAKRHLVAQNDTSSEAF